MGVLVYVVGVSLNRCVQNNPQFSINTNLKCVINVVAVCLLSCPSGSDGLQGRRLNDFILGRTGLT